MTETKLSRMNTVNNSNQLSIYEKKKAAYVLNLCTVSISQIIDYDDINILEQEYEAILNNINLETMPKDEPLLNIFKQLLDTITFFRIQEGDKKIIEKEYQQNVKNAIWNAVPNFGILVAGGDPITIAISLASQVGIGYMNYRRNKAKYNWDKEKQLWQLQRSALEQFNGLRRELFDTAWRLSAVYKFPDEYRLTERQIAQYNQILMDPDPLRQFERLDSIKERFEAYPPFWYFIGHAANYIACNENGDMTNDEITKYREIAIDNFKKFEELIKFNILREDQLAASCMLEHTDILLLDNNYKSDEVKKLIDTAVEISGNKFDVLELCAIAYLKIVDNDESARSSAERILRILVNEDYNKIINAQLLSGIYVKTRNEGDYKILSRRVDSRYLFPMPINNQELSSAENTYLICQKSIVKEKYRQVINEILQRYTVQWNQLIKLYDDTRKYPDNFFYDEESSTEVSINKSYLDSNSKIKEAYIDRLMSRNYELSILKLLNDFCNLLFSIRLYDIEATKSLFVKSIKDEIESKKDTLNDIQNKITDSYQNDKAFSESDYNVIQELKFIKFVLPAFGEHNKDLIDDVIEHMDIKDVMGLDNELREFCLKNNFKEPEVYSKISESRKKEEFSSVYFKTELLGSELEKEREKLDKLQDMRDEIVSYIEKNPYLVQGDNVMLYTYKTTGFETIVKNIPISEMAKHYSLLFLKGEDKNLGSDLLVIAGSVIKIKNNKPICFCPWNKMKLSEDKEAIVLKEGGIGRFEIKYDNKSINKIVLMDLIQLLKKDSDLKPEVTRTRNNELKTLDYLATFIDLTTPGFGILLKKSIEYYIN